MKSKSYEIDMCNGPLTGKILAFYLPLMLSSILQLMFNAADLVVVGRFAGGNALGGVGATSSLSNFLVTVFMGLSVGTNVLFANYYGAGKTSEMKKVTETSVITACVGGLILIFVGLFAAKPLLVLMKTPYGCLADAVLYMRIYFCGMPIIMLYNYGSAILRALGDTKRPLYFLTIAGAVNVILNLIFVIIFNMGAGGVALATVLSQAISAILVLRCLIKGGSDWRLDIKHMHFDKDSFVGMIRIGLPAGIQGSLFSISNMLIQSSVNSFGELSVAGNTAAQNIEGFVYVAMNAFSQASVSFTSQNYGAKKFDRIVKVLVICEGLVTAVGLILGGSAYLFSKQLLRIYASDAEAIAFGVIRITYVCIPYFLCGTMDVACGSLRGMGHGIMPTIVSLSGACLFRIIYIMTFFRATHSAEVLFMSYPISWFITTTAHIICFVIFYQKAQKRVETYVRL